MNLSSEFKVWTHKFGQISHLIGHSLSKRQIIWEIVAFLENLNFNQISVSKHSPDLWQFSFFRAWDCDACVGFVGAVAHVYGSDEGVNAITLALEGESFCKSEEMALDEETMHKCIREIKHFMPKALNVVGHAMHEQSHHICRDWFHGICHHG